MSDIGLNWGLVDYLLLALILGAPGLVIGAICGALAWRRHRARGALTGAALGAIICIAAFMAWAESKLSMNFGFGDLLVLALVRSAPGLATGAAAGAWIRRADRVTGAVLGALVGGVLCLMGWTLVSQMH